MNTDSREILKLFCLDVELILIFEEVLGINKVLLFRSKLMNKDGDGRNVHFNGRLFNLLAGNSYIC